MFAILNTAKRSIARIKDRRFCNDILSRCQREYDKQVLSINQQKNIAQARIQAAKAIFIKTMTLLAYYETDMEETIEKNIKHIRLDGGNEPSPEYVRMINAAQTYYEEVRSEEVRSEE